MNPFKYIGLAKKLTPKFNKELTKFATTETYRKYKLLAEVLEKSGAMNLMFWVLTVLCVVGMVIVFCSLPNTHKPLSMLPIFMWLPVLVWSIEYNQEQPHDITDEAVFAATAIEYLQQGNGLDNCKLRLQSYANDQMECEKNPRPNNRALRFTVYFTIFRAAGLKVGEREDYFVRR